jgi:hypothetical protein
MQIGHAAAEAYRMTLENDPHFGYSRRSPSSGMLRARRVAAHIPAGLLFLARTRGKHGHQQ